MPSSPLPLAPSTVRTVALVGNPNTGKTTLFNALSGLRQRVGNYPGVTVETKKGHMRCGAHTVELIDLPGTYSLAPRSPDEMVAVDVLLGPDARIIDDNVNEPAPDVVVSIVDASNLERNLYLTTQVLELGVPVVVALNMIDVAQSQGLRIDVERLSRQLGVPIVPIQANKKRGLDELRAAILAASGAPAARPSFPDAFETEVARLHESLGGRVSRFLVRRLLLDVGGHVEQRLALRLGEDLRTGVLAARQRLTEAGCAVPAVESRTRYGWLRERTQGCIERPAQRVVTWTDRIDRVLTHRLWGTVLFLTLMFVVFQAIFTGARPLMDGISAGKDFLVDLLRERLPAGPFTSLLLDGVLEGVGAVVVFVPQIMILFGFIAILEDCGYMARAAFLMDRLMARCGLSGKSFIPMLSSVACAVPGIMATRVIENRRDRLATILVAPLMSCSARLPVYILLIAAFFPMWLQGLVMFSMYALGLVVAPLVALALKRTLLRGETPVFVMEMPLYKTPSLRTVLGRMVDSARAFVYRAGTIILATMIVIWALLYFPSRESPGETQAFLDEQQSQLTALHAQLAKAPDDEKAALQEQIERKEQAVEEARREGLSYDRHQALLQEELDKAKAAGTDTPELEQAAEEKEQEHNEVVGRWKRQSWLGRMGRAIEPAVRPLGWDWKIGMAALASFPAREVLVGTLGVIYNEGKVEAGEEEQRSRLAKTLHDAPADDDPERKAFTIPTALSLLVFFALCCQCASTLAVIRRETRSWRWPLFTFTYMTVLAYVGALVVYQVGRLFS